MFRGKRLQEISCVEDFARRRNSYSFESPVENPLDCFDDERRSNRVYVLTPRRGAAFFASPACDYVHQKNLRRASALVDRLWYRRIRVADIFERSQIDVIVNLRRL